MASACIGTYEIRRFLGSGATARVYECSHAALGRLVAVKVLHPHLAHQETSTARFLREGRAISRIRHPNVVQMFDIGEWEGQPYLVMELVDGEDLAKHLRDSSPLSVQAIADLLLPVIAAVGAAHDVGIVHRDLKPSNIRLSRDRLGELNPKVLDFGISKLLSSGGDSDLTETNGALGTAGYMAPEQLRNAKAADTRSDVYSLGVVLYECATGSLPFQASSQYDLMHAILTAPVTAPSALRPELPTELDAIVLRALRRDPAERFDSARDLGLALASFARDPPAWRHKLAATLRDQASETSTETLLTPSEPSPTLGSSSGSSARAPRVRRVVVATAVGLTIAVAIVRVTGRTYPSPVSRAAAGAEGDRAPLGPAALALPMDLPVETPVPVPPEGAAPGAPRERRQGLSPTTPTAHQRSAAAASQAPRRQELGTNRAPILD
jgi:serine/threonine protein kinase